MGRRGTRKKRKRRRRRTRRRSRNKFRKGGIEKQGGGLRGKGMRTRRGVYKEKEKKKNVEEE